MDKIITFIIISYIIIKSLSRFLSGEAEEKKRKPPSSLPSKAETRPAPHPDFPSTWREVGQILRDLKREAEGQQEGIKIPEQIPHGEVSITKQREGIGNIIRKDDQKERVSIKKRMRPKKLKEGVAQIAKAKTIREEKIERAGIPFDQPGIFLQGIILSEILGPPVARRNHLLPPCLRG